MTARDYWRESSHSKTSFVAAQLVSYVFLCCQRAAKEPQILFQTREDCAEICQMPKTIYGNEAVFQTRVCKWFTGFREGHENLEFDPSRGLPLTTRNPETVAKVREMIGRDGQMTPRLLENYLHIKREMIRYVRHQDLEKGISTRTLFHAISTASLLEMSARVLAPP